MQLPYAAEVDAEVSEEELSVLRESYERARSISADDSIIPPQIKFNYAWGLVRSKKRVDQLLGVELFQEISKEDTDRQRECMYYLALGHYRIGDLQKAKKYNDILLSSEPRNMQSQSLKTLIDDKVSKDGFMGMAMVGGVAVIAGVLFAALTRGKGR